MPLAFFYVAAAAMLSIPERFPRTGTRGGWPAPRPVRGVDEERGPGFSGRGVRGPRCIALAGADGWKGQASALMLAGARPFWLRSCWFKLVFAPPNYLFTETAAPLGGAPDRCLAVHDRRRRIRAAALHFGGWLVPPVIVAVGLSLADGEIGPRAVPAARPR